ncbi:uncharacterized protein LOC108431660 [Pygocentrus nattereri]|uniref:uncharacterized protein LOC108431660 n=1 Tax=Pygocentrus nattereri TaxID=42514 RepID=UPI0008145DC6|nr:uncharacterized protein LOC108431660 [Pygocentrus nattereri]
MATTSESEGKFKVKYNSRGIIEISIEGKHMSVQDLKIKIQEDSTLWPEICQVAQQRNKDCGRLKSNRHHDKPKILGYLGNDVPPYPTPVEFHVPSVTHVTTEGPFRMIMESKEFRPPNDGFSWWSLYIDEEEIKSAEERYLQKNFPKLSPEQIESHEPFLNKFTDSPVFQRESRYGNYRFTFPLTDLMELYQQQHCGGEEPVLRVFKTMFYKQEILYAVLIHSPQDNKLFEAMPLLEESRFAHYEKGKIIWHAQAISDNIQYKILTSDKGVEVQHVNKTDYVWDHVCLAFHLPKNTKPHKALKVPSDKLITAIEACELNKMNLIAKDSAEKKRESLEEKAERDKLYKRAVEVVNEVKRMMTDGND